MENDSVRNYIEPKQRGNRFWKAIAQLSHGEIPAVNAYGEPAARQQHPMGFRKHFNDVHIWHGAGGDYAIKAGNGEWQRLTGGLPIGAAGKALSRGSDSRTVNIHSCHLIAGNYVPRK